MENTYFCPLQPCQCMEIYKVNAFNIVLAIPTRWGGEKRVGAGVPNDL